MVPEELADLLGILTVLDHRSTTSDAAYIHYGTLQAPLDALNVDMRDWVVQAPGITTGLPFRLVVERIAEDASQNQNLEPVGPRWRIDIYIDDLRVVFPGLRAARRIQSTTAPTYLEADPHNSRVWVIGRAVMRVASDGNGVTLHLVDQPDPFDPDAPTGEVFEITFSPQHFLFGRSKYGLTLDDFTIDLSDSYTPPAVIARGQDEQWRGVAFHEATFYAPPDTPLVGALSVGLRDVIAGDPLGLQGEFRLEMGQDPGNRMFGGVQAYLVTPSGETLIAPITSSGHISVPVDASVQHPQVRIVFNLPAPPATPTDTDPASVYWQLPDGTEGRDRSQWGTQAFDIPNHEPFRYRVRAGAQTPTTWNDDPTHRDSDIPPNQIELPWVELWFDVTRTGSPSSQPAPKINVTIGGQTWSNVTQVTGTRSALAGIQFASSDSSPCDWAIGSSGIATHERTAQWSPPSLPELNARYDVQMTAANNRTRHLRMELHDDSENAPRLIGHGAPDIDRPSNAMLRQALGQYDLARYHASGSMNRIGDSNGSIANGIHPDQGTLLEVSVEMPAGPDTIVKTTPQTPNDPQADGDNTSSGLAQLSVFFDLEQRELNTSQISGIHSFVESQHYHSAAPPYFLAIGYTDDLWETAHSVSENRSNNLQLAQTRAGNVLAELMIAGVNGTDCGARAVWDDPTAGSFGGVLNAAHIASGTSLYSTLTSRTPDAQADTGIPPYDHPPYNQGPPYDHRLTPDTTDHQQHVDVVANANDRPGMRRVDIYAFTPPSSTQTTPPGGDPHDQQPRPGTDTPHGVTYDVLVPGADGDPPPPPAIEQHPRRNWRLRLRAKWDSPVVATPSDAIPTELEGELSWAAQATIPAGGQTLPAPTPSQPFWDILIRWTYDARSSETAFSAALTLPSNVATIANQPLAGALALAPALMAVLDPNSDDVAGDAAKFVALLVVGAAIGEILNTDTNDQSIVHLSRLELDYSAHASQRVRLVCDYTVELKVKFDHGPANITGTGLRLKYKNVGIEADFHSGGLDDIKMVFDQLSVEVENPGTWDIGGALGQLLRITGSRIGSGSTWIEFDLAFALDLGVVSLQGATIRIIIDGNSVGFEVRGLTVGIDIPNTVSGVGSLTVGEHSEIRGLISVSIIPAKLSAYASLAIAPPMVALEAGVQLPVGIPLANTGLAIYGFMGRFVANGKRNVAPLGPGVDPVQRELDWYCLTPQNKYNPLQGEWALGLGVIIGTMPDGAYTFNAEGELTIAFPEIEVVFGIDALLVSQRKSAATETGTPNRNSFRIKGVTVINADALVIAVRGGYQIPKVLDLSIPISGFFPFHDHPSDSPPDPTQLPTSWYIRVGTDNQEGRTGDPVRLTLLPSTLNAQVWAYLMMEERQLHKLGGDPDLNFDGFSIGFGAGFSIGWSAGPIVLDASVKLLVGFGTNPLVFAGKMTVHGEMSLVVISISFDGQIDFLVTKDIEYLHAHFCGSIDLFFFQLSGCIDLECGSQTPPGDPVPDSPLTGIDLTDHLGAIRGRAALQGSSAAIPTVWPDTVPVLHFSHYLDDAREAAGTQYALSFPEAPTSSPWAGSSTLKFAYRLLRVDLFKLTDPNDPTTGVLQAGPYDGAWWLPTNRPALADANGQDVGPSPQEGRELGLFWWHPAPWSAWLGPGSENNPGDPANTIERVCTPAPQPKRACALGQSAQRIGVGLVAIRPSQPTAPPYPSYFVARGGRPQKVDPYELTAVLSHLGVTLVTGGVKPLSTTYHDADGNQADRGYGLDLLVGRQSVIGTGPFEAELVPPLVQPSLTLEACENPLPPTIGAAVLSYVPSPFTCDKFSEAGTVGTTLRHGKYVYQSLDPKQPISFESVGGGIALRIPLGGLLIQLNMPASAVRVTLLNGGDTATVIALNDAGAVVAQQAVPAGDQPQTVTLQGLGITSVKLVSAIGKADLTEFCEAVDMEAVIERAFGEPVRAADKLPTVIGVRPDGTEVAWKMKLGAGQTDKGCAFVSFAPDDKDPGPYSRIIVLPWLHGRLSLVEVCGITADAAQEQAQDQAARNHARDALHQLSTPTNRTATDGSSRRAILEPGATYQLRVRWQYQWWRDSQNSHAPGPLGAWIDRPDSARTLGYDDVYTFHTAAVGISDAPASNAPYPQMDPHFLDDPTQGGPGCDESVFDERGLSRFFLGFQPTQTDPPHYLDDSLYARFSVDHAGQLLAAYGRALSIEVQRTDPPPGALHPSAAAADGSHPLAVDSSVAWKALERDFLSDAEERMSAAAAGATCIGGDLPLGATAVIDAELGPDASYDILLKAVSQSADNRSDVLIARGHFQTSRYANVPAQMAALNFTVGRSLTPPNDAIATGPLPAAPPPGSDTGLDGALTALGHEAWPLAKQPRTTIFWKQSGSAWQLVAALLESDEPLVRPDRLSVHGLQINNTDGSSVCALHPFASNRSGTRVMLAPDAPLTPPAGREFQLILTLDQGPTPTSTTGSCRMVDRPYALYLEGR
jgi:hypothetical protein